MPLIDFLRDEQPGISESNMVVFVNGDISAILKELPHNIGGGLAGEFQPSAACKFLDLPPGLVSPFSLKTVH